MRQVDVRVCTTGCVLPYQVKSMHALMRVLATCLRQCSKSIREMFGEIIPFAAGNLSVIPIKK